MSPLSVSKAVERREALEELLGTPGWAIFVQHVLNEWQGQGLIHRLSANFDPVLLRTGQELVRVLQWPTDQVRDLKGVSE
jgi:hypothetical protein